MTKMKLSCVDVATDALGRHHKKNGEEFHWLCPNHDDHDPSLSVNPKKTVGGALSAVFQAPPGG